MRKFAGSVSRKIVAAGSALIVIFLLIVLLVPQLLLQLSVPANRSTATVKKESSYFPDDYEQSRERFKAYLPKLQAKWNDVTLQSLPIDTAEGLYIDILQANANKTKQNLVLFTSGVHGIEGFAGSAMLDVFVNEYLSRLDTDNTGIILVHAVNPWGMKHKRRYNEHNVDLNRNFIGDWKGFDLGSNKAYAGLRHFFQNDRALGSMALHEAGFHASLLYRLATKGSQTIEDALLPGQYQFPMGVYYGGTKDEPSTAYIKELYRQVLESGYRNIVHLDLHTGYGPRYQMSIFSSMNETMTEEDARRAFQYPYVITPSSKDFYVTTGDNTQYFNELQKKLAPDKTLYSTTFEFGTLGDGLWPSIQSVKTTIDENRLFWNGASNRATEQIVRNRYMNMFYPAEEKWRMKAVEDFRLAVLGVLKYRKVIQ